ncbi:hypothetical protein SDC9_167591 [bioreactor metagenome]|uniref:Uncharacterized protein n=1 Tax=bioreactor metagenome TaxID=1076179 RepID=A0A645G8G2_9ZZZZ
MKVPLHHFLPGHRHAVVAEIVETELAVHSVGDVAGVRGFPLLRGLPGLNAADRHAEEAVDLAHPLRVALGKVVVDGHDMHALAGERVEVRRKRCHQRFAFACLHLGDAALMQNHAAEQLHVEMTHVHGAHRRLANSRKRLSHDAVQRFAVLQPLAKELCLRAELFVRHRLHLRFEFVDALDIRLQLLEPAGAGVAKQCIQKSHTEAPYIGTFPWASAAVC